MKGKFALRVGLNGTNENPFHRWGLSMNPFGQIAAEFSGADRDLNLLDAEPIPPDRAEAYIREVLKNWDDDFVDLCVRNYRPGKHVKFTVYIPGV